jgi:hypothetical protein
MPVFSVATNGDLATSTKHCPAAITMIGVAAGFCTKNLGAGNLSVLPLPIKKVATKTAAQAIK